MNWIKLGVALSSTVVFFNFINREFWGQFSFNTWLFCIVIWILIHCCIMQWATSD